MTCLIERQFDMAAFRLPNQSQLFPPVGDKLDSVLSLQLKT